MGTEDDGKRVGDGGTDHDGEKAEAGTEPASFGMDLERGLATGHNGLVVKPPRPSTASRRTLAAVGSALPAAASSEDNPSIVGDANQASDGGDDCWGPKHPCYPHLNPHVPVDSAEHVTTRIIRVKRDWLLEGDLAPTFSNMYPEILEPAGLSEHEFRRVIDKLNSSLEPIFDPFSWRNVVDGVLGLVTGWLWDDMGLTATKKSLAELDRWIEQWNGEMEKTMVAKAAAALEETGAMVAPRIIALRRTGYLTLDIQIPDPEIAPVPSTPDTFPRLVAPQDAGAGKGMVPGDGEVVSKPATPAA